MRIVYALLVVLIGLVFMYVQMPYTMKEETLAHDLNEVLGGETTILQVAALHDSTSQVLLLEKEGLLSYSILRKHPFLERWKVTTPPRIIEQSNIEIVTTNRGNYVVISGETSLKQVSLDKLTVNMQPVWADVGLFISTETVPKKYIERDVHVIPN